VKTESFSNNVTLARRLACSAAHVTGLLQSGKLKPVRVGLSRTDYAKRDLDQIRARQIAGLREKAGLLTPEERATLSAATGQGVLTEGAGGVADGRLDALVASHAKLTASVADIVSGLQAVTEALARIKSNLEGKAS
jgi:hypothetical protein